MPLNNLDNTSQDNISKNEPKDSNFPFNFNKAGQFKKMIFLNIYFATFITPLSLFLL